MSLAKKSTIVAMIAMIGATAPAHAYIDPAASSMALQALVGAAMGAAMFGRALMARVRGFFTGQRASDATSVDKLD